MKVTIVDNMQIMTIRAKAFSTEPTGAYTVSIAPGGLIRVYDSVAGYYTTCHALSQRTIDRILRNAALAAQGV